MRTNQDNSNEEPAMMAGEPSNQAGEPSNQASERGMDSDTAQIKIRNWFYHKKFQTKIERRVKEKERVMGEANERDHRLLSTWINREFDFPNILKMIPMINTFKDEARWSLFNEGVFEEDSTGKIIWRWTESQYVISQHTSWFVRRFNNLIFPNRMRSEEANFHRKIAERDYTISKFREAILVWKREIQGLENDRSRLIQQHEEEKKQLIQQHEEEKKQLSENAEQEKNELVQKHKEEIEVVRQTVLWCSRQSEKLEGKKEEEQVEGEIFTLEEKKPEVRKKVMIFVLLFFSMRASFNQLLSFQYSFQ
jgi:hypothetical protein